MKKPILIFIGVITSGGCFADTSFVYNTVAISDSLLLKLQHTVPAETVFARNLPSVIIGVISLAGIIAATINTLISTKSAGVNSDKQLKIVLAKEWVEKVRGYLATCTLQAPVVAKYFLKYKGVIITDSAEKAENDTAHNQLTASLASIGLYVNFKDKLETELYDLVYKLFETSVTGDMNGVIQLTVLTRSKAQEVFENKLKI